ncbi:MAG: DUF4340 domain-containing protein [Planctomycetes bacterium]|nr:DUF4340 domain-containing protein [Planctomycetota bacterium]MCG2685474.1 DUF4340 domain-containing protein [Planctomycetales bacterium]
MNEISKTLTFVAVAAAVVLLAVFTRPVLHAVDPDDLRGQPLYPDFKDPLAVTSLEIVEFDEDTATVHPFLVKQVEVKGKTRWVIPSRDNYPADAKDQVASAAAGMMGLKILEVAGDQRGDQREYGVIDPDPKSLRVGATGVGERIVMQDKDGKELLALVIGKEVPDRPGLRYVRKVGENPIYVVEINTSKLSTKFDDWIERNLLGIETWDMRRLWFRDYSVDELNTALIQRGDVRIAYDDDGQQHWKLIEDRKYEAGKWIPTKLADDEELNVAKLDEMRIALDDLKIVDVSPKPAGLSADLKAAADFANQREAVESLARRGFFVARLENRVELFSNEGEVRVTMKDGVEYVLRFGEIAVGSTVKKDEKPKEGEEAKQPDNGVNRYLFVMAEFNPDIIPKPQFEPLPEIKKEGGVEPAKESKGDEKQPEDNKAETEKADENQPPKPAEKTEAELKAERERIERDNKRKQDEYDRLLSEGKKRMADLNARFADWYYIISNAVFQKIHLTRDELIKKKEKPAEGERGKDGHSDAPSDAAFPAEVLDKLKAQRPAGEK